MYVGDVSEINGVSRNLLPLYFVRLEILTYKYKRDNVSRTDYNVESAFASVT